MHGLSVGSVGFASYTCGRTPLLWWSSLVIIAALHPLQAGIYGAVVLTLCSQRCTCITWHASHLSACRALGLTVPRHVLSVEVSKLAFVNTSPVPCSFRDARVVLGQQQEDQVAALDALYLSTSVVCMLFYVITYTCVSLIPHTPADLAPGLPIAGYRRWAVNPCRSTGN